MSTYKLKYEGEKIDELLESIDNGSVVDANTVSVIEEGNGKPVSSNTIHQALANKVDKIPGKVLSTNDYTIDDKQFVNTAKNTFPNMQSAIANHEETLDNHEWKIEESTNMVDISWSELKEKRDGGDLIAGTFYRIDDYVTTTIQENTNTASNLFDIVVLALSASTLSEEAHAVHSGRDADGYFDNSNLAAWKIWYCLDNDTTRFAWADTDNGTGVIYRMIDEWGNDCPYDFKNIMFMRNISIENILPEISESSPAIWVYTFCARSSREDTGEWSDLKDGSLESPYGHESDEQASTFHHNVMQSWTMIYDNGDEDYTKCGKAYLNDNVFLGIYTEVGGSEEEAPYYSAHCCYNNTLGLNCRHNTFGYDCNNNILKHNNHNLILNNSSTNNTFLRNCCDIELRGYCYNNIFGDNCYDILLSSGCSFVKFGLACRQITIGENSYNITFGSDCRNVSMNNSYNITIGNCSESIKFGSNASCCVIGDYCKDIRFLLSNGSTSGENYSNIVIDPNTVSLSLSSSQSEGLHDKKVMSGNYAGTNIVVLRNSQVTSIVSMDAQGQVKDIILADI